MSEWMDSVVALSYRSNLTLQKQRLVNVQVLQMMRISTNISQGGMWTGKAPQEGLLGLHANTCRPGEACKSWMYNKFIMLKSAVDEDHDKQKAKWRTQSGRR